VSSPVQPDNSKERRPFWDDNDDWLVFFLVSLRSS
jgi:hypothetical protein